MKRTLEQMKKLYPLGTKVAYDRGLDKPDLGVVIDYCRVPDGFTAEDDSWALRVGNWEYPEYKYSSEWRHVYISVLLSFLSRITPNRHQVKIIDHHIQTNKIKYKHYNITKEEKIILFELDNTWEDLVKILCRRLQSKITKELSECLQTTFIFE